MKPQRILGVDPGLRITGYGIVDVDGHKPKLVEAGVIQPDAGAPLERRLAELHDALAEIVRGLRPDCVVIEELWSSYRHPATAVLMGHARGVLCSVAGSHGVTVNALAHALVKRALVGSGGASKEQVKKMVAQLLGLRTLPQPDDVSDALALALAFAFRNNGCSRA
ncbi:MAG: crossover junction endodeoxyribonuclease RuvC [Candidatus Eremiobacteraeota bacterium]|nr:crossover junction endodeoxyribonuclease RuvC [Candidatus Eremiobacteraeota bacterium]MBV8354090.1 crossover junction endodeoxyribonuclease RuvC [Candidatus Eremiobacteraeota bacterium]